MEKLPNNHAIVQAEGGRFVQDVHGFGEGGQRGGLVGRDCLQGVLQGGGLLNQGGVVVSGHRRSLGS